MQKPPLGITARCEVVKPIDGDTLDVVLRIPARVRLLDCWAPETRTLDADEKERGLLAKVNLAALTMDKHGVVFIPTGQAHSVKDIITLDRVLGRVWMDGDEQDLSSQQVAAGHATKDKP